MKPFSDRMADLRTDAMHMARLTHYAGWVSNVEDDVEDASASDIASTAKDVDVGGFKLPSPDNIKGKQIRIDAWMKAVLIAHKLCEAHPHIDRPALGADPEGFVCLTWIDGPHGLALQLRGDRDFQWTQRDGNGKKTIRSDSLHDVAEAMRAVFRRPS